LGGLLLDSLPNKNSRALTNLGIDLFFLIKIYRYAKTLESKAFGIGNKETLKGDTMSCFFDI
jgi:hypothetical protein